MKKYKPGDIVMMQKPWTTYIGVVTRVDYDVPGLITPICVKALRQFYSHGGISGYHSSPASDPIPGSLTNYALDDDIAMVCPGEDYDKYKIWLLGNMP